MISLTAFFNWLWALFALGGPPSLETGAQQDQQVQMSPPPPPTESANTQRNPWSGIFGGDNVSNGI